jgi:hypothetical protein
MFFALQNPIVELLDFLGEADICGILYKAFK